MVVLLLAFAVYCAFCGLFWVRRIRNATDRWLLRLNFIACSVGLVSFIPLLYKSLAPADPAGRWWRSWVGPTDWWVCYVSGGIIIIVCAFLELRLTRPKIRKRLENKPR